MSVIFNPTKWEKVFETEEQMQAQAMLMINHYFPEFRDKVWHTKNEGFISRKEDETDKEYERRKMMEGSRNKAAGMLAGVMDILLLRNGILYKVELKLPGGVVSLSQKRIHEIWNEDCPNIPVIVCRTMKEIFDYCVWVLEKNYRISFSGISPINSFYAGRDYSFYNYEDYVESLNKNKS